MAAAVKALARRDGWAVTAALAAAAAVLARVGEWRAVDDVAALLAARPLASPPEEPPEGVAAVAAVERRLACAGALLPHGVPAAWLGAALEAHGLPIGPSSTLSFALRWHGERPAVLWEISGEQVALTAPALDPAWRTSEPCGEALWPAPPGAADPAAVGPPPVT